MEVIILSSEKNEMNEYEKLEKWWNELMLSTIENLKEDNKEKYERYIKLWRKFNRCST
jgi:hypothetical protein